jgi:hypothetical protein
MVRSATPIVLAGAFAAGAAGGFLASLLWLQPSRGAAEPAARGGEREAPGDLKEAVARLESTVRLLADRLDRAVAAPASQGNARERAVAGGGAANPNKDEILAAIDRLAAAISGPGAPGARAPGAPPLALSPQLSQKKLAETLASFDATNDRQAVTDEHLFLTYQQILDRYGRPSRAMPFNSGVLWEYEIKNTEGSVTGTIGISFYDGMVLEVTF